MKILISGGGLAGLTLAYWLNRYGFTPVVIEQAQGMRHDGYGIDFFGTGYDVASRMNLIDTLNDRKIPIEYIAYVNASGAIQTRMDIALMEKVMRGKYLALMHWTLEEVLYDAVKNDVEIRFGRTLKAVRQSANAVDVTFDDGSTETFDLLIGADGIHSNTRGLVFGPESQFSHYMGYYIVCAPVPDRYGIGRTWKNYTEPGRQVGAYCSSNEGDVIATFMYAAPDEGYIPRDQRLPRLRKVFADMGWVAQPMLNDIHDPSAIYMDTVTQIHMPIWSQGRVALVGDACGCMTLISGQGASMAFGGAYVLAEALHKHTDYQSAFRAYEQQMRPPIETRQKNARSFAKAFVPGSKWEMTVQRMIMNLVLRDAFIPVLRRQFGSESILSA